MTATRIPFLEKVAYGSGNIMPTLVTATTGLSMYFYTDVAGLAPALVGAMVLIVRIVDAFWDIWVGQRVDRTRTRWGQGRPYLLWFAPVLALAIVASFIVPPLQEPALSVYFVVAYVLLWFSYSLIQIPQQSMMPLVATDPGERLKLANVNMFMLFLFVVIFSAGFPILKDALAAGDQARGFFLAALAAAGLGFVATLQSFAVVRERAPATTHARHSLMRDLGALWRNGGWRSGIAAHLFVGLVTNAMIAVSIYYFTVLVKAPDLIGPFLGLQGIGLIVGVLLSGRLTSRFCKKHVFVASMAGVGLVLPLFYVIGVHSEIPVVFAIGFAANLFLGTASPMTLSLLSDTADDIELREGTRVVGTLFATVNFAQKVAAGLLGAALAWALAFTHYQAGSLEQTPDVLQCILILMGPAPALIALAAASVIAWGYPLGRVQVSALRDALAQQRAATQVG